MMSLSYKNHHFFINVATVITQKNTLSNNFWQHSLKKNLKKKRIDDLEANVSLGALI